MNIYLAEYKNYINADKEPVGHGYKYINEIAMLLGNKATIMCSKEYQSSRNDVMLPYSCSNNYHDKIEKTKNIVKKICNILIVLLNTKTKIIWFTNVDWVLFFVLGILPCNKEVIITAYTSKEKLRSKCPKKIFENAFNKIKLIVKTNPNLKYDERSFFVPDFYYTDNYSNYHTDFSRKKNAILVIGTIREEKDILGAVEVLNVLGCEALICGKFFDENVYRICVEKSSNNIRIDNRIVPEDEYYRLISSYKYVFLPYKNDYQSATSGVLLETIFLGSVPIAPRFLLDFNGISGIGYNAIEEVPTNFKNSDANSILVVNEQIISEYHYNRVYQKLKDKLKVFENNV